MQKRCSHVDIMGRAPSQGTSAASPASSLDTQRPPARPDDSQASVASVQPSTRDASPLPRLGDHQTSHRAAYAGLSEDAYLRFVGDLSPEASFLTGGAQEHRNSSASRHADVGVWLGQKPDDQAHVTDQGHPVREGNALLSRPVGLTCLQTFASQLRQECMAVLPPAYEFKLISELYYKKIDPLFPILHGEVLEEHNIMEAVALKQCICLSAALDPSLRGHLRLPHTERILSQIDFRACGGR